MPDSRTAEYITIIGHRCTEAEKGRRLEYLSNLENAVSFEKASDLGATALVIAPASVVENWARELDTWTYLTVAIYKPSHERQNKVLKSFRRGRLDVGELADAAALPENPD